MAVSISPGKRSCSIVWKVGKIESCISNVFHMEDSKWCFVLETETHAHHNELDWRIFLRKIHPIEGNHIFLITIYLQNKYGKLECINFTRLIISKPGTERILWRRKSNVLEKFPDVVLEDDVTFVITLLSDHQYMKDLEHYTDSKLIQTPEYMETHPCVESLAMDYRKLMDGGSEPDIELHCGGRIVQAHKAVLIARSTVFSSMLQSDMLEKNDGFVEIVDVEFTILEHFLKYLYSGTLPHLNVDIATGLYEAADKYAVYALKTRCALYLREHLTAENALNLLVVADTHYDKDLRERIISYIIHKDVLMYMEEEDAFFALYPKLAVSVLYRAYKIMKLSLRTSK